MKKFLCSLIIASLCLTGFAQTPSVNFKMGPVKKIGMSNMFTYTEPVGKTDNKFYGILIPTASLMTNAIGNKKYSLFSLGQDLSTVKYEIIQDEQDKMSTDYEFLLEIKGTLYLFVSFQNQKIKKTILLAKPVNKRTLLPEGKLKPVTEVDYSQANKYKTTRFSYEFSADSSKIMIYHGLSDKDGMLLGGFDLLDENLKTIWNDDAPLPIKDRKVYELEHFAVSNSGDIHILCKIYDSKKKFNHSTKSKFKWIDKSEIQESGVYDYTLFSIKNKGKDRVEHPLEIKDKFIRTLAIGCNDKNEALCAGLYCNKQSLCVTGCCSFILADKAGADLIAHHAAFDVNMIAKGLDKDDAADLKDDIKSGDEFEAYNYEAEPIILGSSGNFWFAGEQQKKFIKSNSNGKQITTTWEYIQEGLYLVCFKPDGSISWQNKLAKFEHTADLWFIFGSYKLHMQNDNLFVLYNNFPRTSGIKNPKKAVAYVATYDKDGTETIKKLADIKQSAVTLIPKYAGYFDEKTMVVLGFHNRKYRFMTLSFD